MLPRAILIGVERIENNGTLIQKGTKKVESGARETYTDMMINSTP